MKFFILAALLTSFSAQASYFATHCSNAQGTIQWRSGHNDNMMVVKYGEEEHKMNVHKLNIKFEKEVVLKDEKADACAETPIYSTTKVWAAKAIITPKEHFPQTETTFNKLIETEVICEFHMNSRMYCPDDRDGEKPEITEE